MSVKSQVQAAEEALRQALINALAEGDEQFLSELFAEYQRISDLNKKVQDKITFDPNYSFDLSSTYLNNARIGGDLDAMDNVISFGGDTVINTDNDTISFT
ncbi:MAG: hypothetical protein CL961_07055 [Euryarchaeota archaeon]|nr:hypothetical protein [Euryarchaeota archaeon]